MIERERLVEIPENLLPSANSVGGKKMGLLQLIILLMELCLTANAFHFHESADHAPSHISHPGFGGQTRHGKLVAPPPKKPFHFHHKWLQPEDKVINIHDAMRPPSIALPPSMSSSGPLSKKWTNGPLSSPAISHHKHHHKRKRFNISSPEPFPPTYTQQGPSVSPFQSPFTSPSIWSSPESASAESPTTSSSHYNMPIFAPTVSPMGSSLRKLKAPPPSSILALPPPPPNTDCSSVTCTEPLTNAPTGSPCGCVLPIQVKLHLGIPMYTFFPLVSELAKEIAASIVLNYSQVRIMGADAASQQLDKTAVLVNLVPRGVKFDYITAFQIYDKFWRRQVSIKESFFGAYEVLYVHYPGLPPSPPSSPLSISTVDDGPHGGQENNGMAMKPLGVDVSRMQHKGLGKSLIAVIFVSSFSAFIICLVVAWILLVKSCSRNRQSEDIPQALISSPAKTTEAARSAAGSKRASETMSFSCGTMTYTGSAKIFTLNEIERATNNFDPSRVLGEGGFGLVYSGTLDDGRKVAVKILKRDDHHSGRDFLAEVEMLSRLHHRNLVKLFGICTEGQTRCLLYELVPNQSVESHLHGIDKEADPLGWDARIKIALGAARGLAYLHEDSSPRVIHRDFKSSNILLEHDFTPKVSDFGLARTALEGNRHVSTHVMGTFGYLAPEYAMTGHLLVKSDVYSYGVVLLELLTGRKPVDLSQPPGQENLVAWARPLLTSKEGLETIIDPAIIKQDDHGQTQMRLSDSVAKVAAIASMCVQPEVSHRPFMGEVFQALKLVCNEFDETKGLGSKCCSQDDFLADIGHDHHADSSTSNKTRTGSGEILEASTTRSQDDVEQLSTSGLLSASVGVEEQELGSSFRRYSSSGPLRSEGRRMRFWQRLRSLSWGSVSEHGLPLKIMPGSR